MSDLYHKLGPQGRALLAQNSGLSSVPPYSPTTTTTSTATGSPQELDYLINELRNPNPDTTVNKVLGYLYNYVPYIKHEQNLRLVIASFLNTPVCFNAGNLPSFEENYPIIEVFKLIFDKKLKISMPTLPIKTFYSILLKELKHFQAFNPSQNSWKVLPILCGVFLSNELRNELYSEVNFVEYKWFFDDWDKDASDLFGRALNFSISETFPNNINYLSLISFALVYKKGENVAEKYTRKVASSLIITRLMEMVFLDPNVSTLVYQKFFLIDPNTPEIEKVVYDEIMGKPVVKHLNKLSFLLDAYFTTLGFKKSDEVLVRDSLVRITHFNKTLNHATNKSMFNDFNGSKQPNPLVKNFWFFMKSLLFSEIIVFQGILTRFVTANSKFGSSFFWFGGRSELSRIEYEYKDIALELIPNLYYINFILLSIGQGGFDNYNFVYYLTLELALTTGIRFEKNTMYLIGNYQEINLHPDVLNKNYIDTSKVIFVLGLWENYLQLSHRQPRFCQEVYNVAIGLVDDKKYDNDELLEAAHSVLLFYFANSETINIVDVLQFVELLLLQYPQRLSENQLNIAIETLGKKIFSSPDHPAGERFMTLLIAKKCYIPLIQLIPYIPIDKFLPWVNRIHDLIGAGDTEEDKMFWKVLTERLDPNRTELALYSFY
ncbi:Peroxisomal biogenesis factor 8 [Candida viswanathii]|uniref:Peroxisomal biogenesis factor 8 n=1 Tax=Candida viswanathii TaxID=5486 RepID=A0A367YJ25_9ASCO|nr:Peroxisomal biogenesis factor 8 [Candida viswanathii]